MRPHCSSLCACVCIIPRRELAACIYGELAAGMETSAAIVVVQGLSQLLGVGENGKEASLEKRQGSMLALGYILSHAVDPVTNAHKLPKETVSSVLLALTLALSERRTEVVSSAARAIGLAGLHCTLMLPPGKMPPPAGPLSARFCTLQNIQNQPVVSVRNALAKGEVERLTGA